LAEATRDELTNDSIPPSGGSHCNAAGACCNRRSRRSERAGIINIGLEGVILSGCFGGLLGATHGGALGGYAASMLCGVAAAIGFALFAVWLRADQIISGTAVTLLAVGLTGTLYRTLYGAAGAGLSIPTTGPGADSAVVEAARDWSWSLRPTARDIRDVFTRAARVVVDVQDPWRSGASRRRRKSRGGRGGGHSCESRPVWRDGVRWGDGGLAGGTLVLAQAGTFAEGMSAGRGFIAIAIVVLGRWHPLGVAAAALVFGAASALQFLLQALGLALPYQLFLALPYVLTLAGLAAWRAECEPLPR